MADNKIKISADVSAIRKSLLDVSKEVKHLGKSKVAIFDQSQKNFLEKEAKKHLVGIRSEIEANNKKILLATKLMDKEGRSLREQVKTRKKISSLIKEQVKLQKDAERLQTMSTSTAAQPKGIMGRLGGMLGGVGSKLGMGSLLKGGALGLALGTGAFAVGRARKAYSTFEGGIDDRLKLRGRGVGDMNLSDSEGAASVGLNAQSMRRARLASMDVFGKGGSTQNAVMQRAAFERNFGLEQGTSRGIGSQLRGTLGGAGAEKATMQIQASLIASGITDEIGPYLETAASMLSTINEKGITFTSSAMGVLSDLASRDGVSAERAGRLATGVDSAIRGSSGEANAFFQQAFSSAGLGGGTLGGIQASIRSGGLFGANLGADSLIGDADRRALESVGLGRNDASQRAGGILNKINELFSPQEGDNAQQTNDRNIQKLDFTRRTFGLSSEVEAANVLELLKSVRDGSKSREEAEKELQKIQSGNSELGNLKMINKSTEASVSILKDIRQSMLDEAGENLAPIFRTIDKTMMKLDATLSAMMGFFGIEAPDVAAKEGLSGSGAVTQEELDQFTAGDPEAQKKFKAELRSNYDANEKRIQELESKRSGDGRLIGDDLRELQKAESRRSNFMETAGNIGADLNKEEFSFSNNNRTQAQSLSPQNGMQNIADILSKMVTVDNKKQSTPVDTETPAILNGILNETRRGNATRERMSRKPSNTVPAKTLKSN